MDFTLSLEQTQLIEALDEAGKKEFAPRAAGWDTNRDHRWDHEHMLQNMGLPGTTVPGVYGGPGLPLVDAALAVTTV